jgi:hypothetical protein
LTQTDQDKPLAGHYCYCDNISIVYMFGNPVQYWWTKPIESDIHFVRDKVASGQVRVLRVPTSAQFDDIFTMGLTTTPFSAIHFTLKVVKPHVDSVAVGGREGGCYTIIWLPSCNIS